MIWLLGRSSETGSVGDWSDVLGVGAGGYEGSGKGRVGLLVCGEPTIRCLRLLAHTHTRCRMCARNRGGKKEPHNVTWWARPFGVLVGRWLLSGSYPHYTVLSIV